MSIALAIPVGVMAVSSLTVVPEAQAWGLKKIKRVAKRKHRKTKNFVTAKNCPGDTWVNGYHGLCGRSVNPIPTGRIGDPVNTHDHRRRRPGGVP